MVIRLECVSSNRRRLYSATIDPGDTLGDWDRFRDSSPEIDYREDGRGRSLLLGTGPFILYVYT